MALALYRTYRPATLSEVVGQEQVTGPLARALDGGRVHHAYLFSGPRGCGKTSTARILARSLNCEQGPTSHPCGTCPSCVQLAPNGSGSIDVVEMDAATHRGIDDARELRERAVYAPAVSRFKVYIIDEAHQLTSEAANALLKLIEEPPAHLRFVFATTEPERIIPTIRSRTFHYSFRLVPARTLVGHLSSVCQAEGIPAEAAALALVARSGGGSVRDSLSILGQLLSSGDPLTYQDAVAALGLSDARLIDSFVSALTGRDAALMFRLVDNVIASGQDPRRFVSDLLERLRDLIILKADPEALVSGLVDVPEDLGQALVEQAGQLGAAQLSRAADLLSVGLSEVKGATAPRLQLELLCARAALVELDDSPTGILARLEVLESGAPGVASASSGGQLGARGGDAQTAAEQARPAAAPEPVPSGPVGSPGDVPPQNSPRPAHGTPRGVPRPPTLRSGRGGSAGEPDRAPAAPTPTLHPAPPAGPVGGAGDQLAAVRAAWLGVLTALKNSSRVAWIALESAEPLSISDGVLAVGLPDAGRISYLTKSGHDERLRQAILAVVNLDLRIDVVLHPARTSQSATGPGTSSGATATQGKEGRREAADADEPSVDDPDLDSARETGIGLITRELGGRPIGEIDHS